MLRRWMPLVLLIAATHALIGTRVWGQSAPVKVPFERLSTEGIKQALEYSLANNTSTQIPVLREQGITIVTSGVVYEAAPGARPSLRVPYRGVAAALNDAQQHAIRTFLNDAIGQHLLEGPGLFSDRATIVLVPESTSTAPPVAAKPSPQGAAVWPSPQGVAAWPSPQGVAAWPSPQAIVAQGHIPSGQAVTADSCFGQGYDLYWQGRYHEALARFNDAIGRTAEDPRYWYYKGLSEAVLGDTPGAEASIRQGGVTERKAGSNTKAVGRSLERVQGAQRLWLEKVAAR